MVTIIHFGDVHLGMTNFGRLDATTGLHSRILDYLDALDCIVAVAEEIQPDIILFAGDAFRTRTPNPTLVTQFSHRIQALANIATVIMVVGNHDRQHGGEEKKHSIDIMESLSARHQIIVSRDVQGLWRDDAYIVTLPWLYDKTYDDICNSIDHALEPAPDDVPCILLGHCTIDTVEVNGIPACQIPGMRDTLFPLEMFCDDVWDYVALGHVHKHQCLCERPPVVYCGSLERVDWGERDDPKGFIVAEVECGRANWRFVDIQATPMVQITTSRNELRKLTRKKVTDSIVRVIVNCEYSESNESIHSDVLKYLPDDYALLDSINLHIIRRDRLLRGKNLESLKPMDLLEKYLDDKYPDDPDYVDLLCDYALDIMEE